MATHVLKKRIHTATTTSGHSSERQEEIYQRALQVRKTVGKAKETARARGQKLELTRKQIFEHPMHNVVRKFLHEQGAEGQEFLHLLFRREQESIAYKASLIDTYRSIKDLHKLHVEYLGAGQKK